MKVGKFTPNKARWPGGKSYNKTALQTHARKHKHKSILIANAREKFLMRSLLFIRYESLKFKLQWAVQTTDLDCLYLKLTFMMYIKAQVLYAWYQFRSFKFCFCPTYHELCNIKKVNTSPNETPGETAPISCHSAAKSFSNYSFRHCNYFHLVKGVQNIRNYFVSLEKNVNKAHREGQHHKPVICCILVHYMCQ